MTRKGSLSAENLAALGAERLADLLMELAEADAALRKRLVLAAAEGDGAPGLIKAVDRRLKALAASRGYIDWEKTRAYASELDGLRRAIGRTLTPLDAGAAAERLETFVRLAPSVFERVDDSSGRFGQLFQAAVADLGAAWSQAHGGDPEHLARRVFELVLWDEYGVCDELIGAAATALGDAGLAALADLARAAMAASSGASRAGVAGWRARRLQQALVDIADAQGDVDAFIAAETATGDARADILGIARRLIEANRPDEALGWLDRKSGRPELRVMTYADMALHSGNPDQPIGIEWERENLRIRALEMLRRRPEAQDIRWRLFERTLHPDLLRHYLNALPDFEDEAALDRARALARSHASATLALSFLVRWPDLDLAAEIVDKRAAELDGRHYEILEPAAEALAERRPHAAIALYRRMIDSVLERGASAAYRHAAENLKACERLAGQIDGAAAHGASHADYVAALRRRHGRKSGFWSLVP